LIEVERDPGWANLSRTRRLLPAGVLRCYKLTRPQRVEIGLSDGPVWFISLNTYWTCCAGVCRSSRSC